MPTNYPTSVDALTNPTATSARNSVSVPHSGQHANANDALEAIEAKVGTGASTPTTAGHVLAVTGAGATAFQSPATAFLPLDLGTGTLTAQAVWDTTRLARSSRTLSAAGTGSGGSANEWLHTVQAYIPNTASAANYEKAAMFVETVTADPTADLVNRDAVGIDTRGTIGIGNLTGRAWGLFSLGRVWAGGDGLSIGAEIAILNGGTDQPATATRTSKYGVHIAVEDGTGMTEGTAAIYIDRQGSRVWHKGLYAASGAIGTGTDDSFLELYGSDILEPRFRVRQDGQVYIQTTNETAMFITDVGATGVIIRLTGNGATTPKKFIRVSAGTFQILNDAFSAALMTLNDNGAMVLGAGLTLDGSLTMPESGHIVLGTASGSLIATTSSQKLAFWGATPVIRQAGWGWPTGSATRTTFATTTVTTEQLAERVMGLITDLKTYGLLGG